MEWFFKVISNWSDELRHKLQEFSIKLFYVMFFVDFLPWRFSASIKKSFHETVKYWWSWNPFKTIKYSHSWLPAICNNNNNWGFLTDFSFLWVTRLQLKALNLQFHSTPFNCGVGTLKSIFQHSNNVSKLKELEKSLRKLLKY